MTGTLRSASAKSPRKEGIPPLMFLPETKKDHGKAISAIRDIDLLLGAGLTGPQARGAGRFSGDRRATTVSPARSFFSRVFVGGVITDAHFLK